MHSRRVGNDAASLPRHRPPQRLDRQLVADAHRLVAGRLDPGALHRRRHPRGDLRVGLTPRRLCADCAAATSCADRAMRRHRARPVDPERFRRLDQVVVGVDRQAVPRRDRRRGLLCALQRRGDDVDDVAVGQPVGDRLRLGLAALRQVVVGQPAVEDLLRVVHLAVAHHVHDRLLGHAGAVVASAAARAAPGRAAAMRSNASSSRAVETNQVSNALGGG